MDGIEAAKIIRGKSDYYADSPVIALTANALSGMREMYIANGFSDFLAKPVEMPKLNAILTAWIPPEKQRAAAKPNAVADNKAAILEVFAADARERLSAIPKCLESGDMKLFATYVHALKSASANAGYKDLSEKARLLESAAKDNDNAYIDKNIGDFIKTLEDVIRENEKPLPEKTDIPREKLLGLRTALTALDIGEIDRITAEIGSAMPRDIAECILISDYERAVELIDSINAV